MRNRIKLMVIDIVERMYKYEDIRIVGDEDGVVEFEGLGENVPNSFLNMEVMGISQSDEAILLYIKS